jgi:hypothetical protein
MKAFPRTQWINIMALLGAFALAGGPAPAQEPTGAKNLLANGAFEKGMAGWTVDSHGKNAQVSVDENEKYNDKPSLRVENVEGSDTHVKQMVTVKPNTRYRLAGYIKTKDVQQIARDGRQGACLDVFGGYEQTLPQTKTKPWTRVWHDFTTGKETKIGLEARLGFLDAETTGTAWFADLSLEEIIKPPQ